MCRCGGRADPSPTGCAVVFRFALCICGGSKPPPYGLCGNFELCILNFALMNKFSPSVLLRNPPPSSDGGEGVCAVMIGAKKCRSIVVIDLHFLFYDNADAVGDATTVGFDFPKISFAFPTASSIEWAGIRCIFSTTGSLISEI